MKMFAVILASIAAIAASAQAYLIWRDGGREVSQRDYSRINNCRNLITSLSELGRVTKDSEQTLQRHTQAMIDDMLRYQELSDDDSGVDEARFRSTAERRFLGNANLAVSRLQNFVDIGSLFFSEAENTSIGYEAIEDAVSSLGPYRGYDYPNPENFDETVAKLENAAAQLSGVRSVCEPILLDDRAEPVWRRF